MGAGRLSSQSTNVRDEMRECLTFPHLRNPDGSYDSICRACYATVARVKNECELKYYESRHKCDLLAMYQSLAPALKPTAQLPPGVEKQIWKRRFMVRFDR
jgi:hypothetical protein